MSESCIFCTNKRGGYFFGSSIDFSAYQGWTIFLEEPWELFKIVDSVSGAFDVNISDKSLFFSNESEQEVVIDLDFRFIHDFDDKGRIYDVYSKDDFLIVKFTKFSDDSLKDKVFTKFLAIKGLANYNLIFEWVKKYYVYDAERKSRHDFYVFRLLKGVAKKIVFGVGLTEEDAVVSARVELPSAGESNFSFIESSQTKLFDEVKEAILKVDNAFSSCVKINKNKEFMIFAGYPWFYQVWARDECISLIGLFLQKKYDVARQILLRNLSSMSDEGILPNRFPSSVLGSADSTGWLFQRIRIFLEFDKSFFSPKDLLLVEQKLDLFLDFCKKNSYKGLVYNGPKETWMDTTGFNDADTREGARVEIQALHLSALHLKHRLRKLSGDSSEASKFKHKLNKKKSLVRKWLIKNNVLHDGFVNNVLDKTARPNVFLAYYAYPGLAMKNQWESTFDFVLGDCWLDWGGLSSIGKSTSLFRDTYSGMDNESYHRGDSWFFVNNISAIVLRKFNSKKYKSYISKIKQASIHELLYSGFIGFCAEVSSAKNIESKGCLSQAWSAATLLELLVEKD